MRYLGGKSRIRKELAEFLNARRVGPTYWEPFVGGAWVAMEIDAPVMLLSDAHPELIAMWRAVSNGWVPPKVVTEEQYARAKQGCYPAHLRGFIGFGCSFAGKWFGGYARDAKGSNYARISRDSILRKIRRIPHAYFFEMPYDEFNADIPVKMQIYCDPPYADTTGYDKFSSVFDSGAFWDTVRQWSRHGHDVFVSEYNAPDDFVCVWEAPSRMGLRNTDEQHELRTERLFQYNGV